MREVKELLSIVALSTLLGFSANSGVGAQEGKEQPLQEVFQTELVYPQEKGEIQLTLAPRFREGDSRDIIQIPLTIEYGITDAWQVEFEWDFFVHRNPTTGASANGPGDLEIGTKYSFMNIAGTDFHIAVSFDIAFPLGDVNKGLTEGFIEYEPFFILARDFPQLNDLQLFTQVGVGLVQRVKKPDDPDDEEPAAHEFIWNSGFFIPFGPLVFTTEFNWNVNTWNNGGKENQMYITPGLVLNLSGPWEVGIGTPVGLTDDADNYRIIGMLTYEF